MSLRKPYKITKLYCYYYYGVCCVSALEVKVFMSACVCGEGGRPVEKPFVFIYSVLLVRSDMVDSLLSFYSTKSNTHAYLLWRENQTVYCVS